MAVQITKISFTTENNFLQIKNSKNISDAVNTEKYTYVKKFRIPFIGLNIWRRTERILSDVEDIQNAIPKKVRQFFLDNREKSDTIRAKGE